MDHVLNLNVTHTTEKKENAIFDLVFYKYSRMKDMQR